MIDGYEFEKGRIQAQKEERMNRAKLIAIIFLILVIIWIGCGFANVLGLL